MRKRYKKQKTIVILFALGIICCFSIGYAAFSQNFLVSGKGTVVVPKGPIASEMLKEKMTTTGDGLYLGEYESTGDAKKYIYKGANPDNYITFNNETWRILSVEGDKTIKIIRENSIGSRPFDSKGLRDSTSNGAGGTYCVQGSNGCNAWAINDNFVNGTKSGSVLKDAELNTYLNGAYLETINGDKQYIVNHDFNVGTPGDKSDTEDIATDVQQEALYKWNGKIGLMTVTEILKTTTDTGCTSLKVGNNSSSKSACSNNNWLWPKSDWLWTISPASTNSYSVWEVASSGYVFNSSGVYYDEGVLPTVYLTSDIILLGEGTQDKPYTIVNN